MRLYKAEIELILYLPNILLFVVVHKFTYELQLEFFQYAQVFTVLNNLLSFTDSAISLVIPKCIVVRVP